MSLPAIKIRLSIVLAVFLAYLPKLSAQDNQNSFVVAPIEGIKIFAPQTDPLKGNFWGVDVAYRINMHENNTAWIKKLHVKDIAITARYLDLQNIYFSSNAATKGFLGNTFAAFTIVDIQLWQTGNTLLLFTPGVGMVYDTKSYYNNVYNSLIGSAVNLGLNAGVKVETPVSSATRFTAGINAFHYSNSGSKLPNYGITNLNATVGVITSLDATGTNRELAHFDTGDKNSFEFGIGLGRRGLVQTSDYVKQIPGNMMKPIDSVKQRNAASHLYMMGLYAGYNYRLNPIVSLRAGTDVVYYFKPFNENDFADTYQASGSSYDKYSLGASLGADLWLGRLVLAGSYGYYLHYASITPEHFYWNLGGKYYLNRWVALNAKIYLHGTEAQYANFGLAFNVY